MIRFMQEADLSQAVELELLCFSDPWSERLLRESLAGTLDIWYVSEEEGTITGFGNLRILGDEGEIQRIAVHPDCRGKGYGKKLMEQMVTFAKAQGVKEMTLEVRAGNLPAISLYESFGFLKEAVRRGYYQNPDEDGLIMWNRGI